MKKKKNLTLLGNEGRRSVIEARGMNVRHERAHEQLAASIAAAPVVAFAVFSAAFSVLVAASGVAAVAFAEALACEPYPLSLTRSLPSSLPIYRSTSLARSLFLCLSLFSCLSLPYT